MIYMEVAISWILPVATLSLSCQVKKGAVDSDDGKMNRQDLAVGHHMGDIWFITATGRVT